MTAVLATVTCLLAAWLFDVGLWWGPPALLVGVVVTALVGGLMGALAARLVGIRLTRVEVGAGRTVTSRRVGETQVVLRRLPVMASWRGFSRNRAATRWQFWIAQLVSIGSGAALVLAATGLPDGDVQRGLVVGAALCVALGFLPMTDEFGTAAPGWQVLTVPFVPERAIEGWYTSERVAQARRAIDSRHFPTAEKLLRDELAAGPSATARRQLSLLLLRLGRYPEAVEMTRDELDEPDVGRAERIGRLNNHAWALLLAAESGAPVEGWRGSARRALDEAEALAGADNPILMSTRALYEALDGDADAAMVLARWALDMSTEDEDRADELLTLAVATSRADDDDAVQEWLRRAAELSPDSPRIPGVRRLVEPPPTRRDG